MTTKHSKPKIACPNCGDANRRGQRPLNDEDSQFQCHKCGMVYRVDNPPAEGPLPICPACKSTLVVVGRLGMSCSNCGHVEPHEDAPAARKQRRQSAIRTYQATTPDGRTVRCTVPEDPTPDEVLFDAIKDNFSPQAVAAMAAYLQAANTKNRRVNQQLTWFAKELIKMVGATGYGRLLEEVGL